MRRKVLGVLAVVLAGGALLAIPSKAAAPAPDSLKRAATIDKPSVVLVTITESAFVQDNRTGKTYGKLDGTAFTASFQGTGFFISSDGYIVTAAHLAAPTSEDVKNDIVNAYLVQDVHDPTLGNCDATGDCQAQITSHQAGYLLASTLTEEKEVVSVLTQNMTSADQALPAEVKASSPAGQRDTAVLKVAMSNTPVLEIGDSSKVQDGDAVSIIGYPGIASTGSSVASQVVPTVTTGTITAHKQGSADIGLAAGVNVLQTDATAEHGNSGGPAIDVNGNVIGILSFGPTSTTNFLITAKDVGDVVKQSGASNASGQIDKLWRDGLAYYDQQRYKKAAEAFHQCTVLNAAQVGCAAYDQQATTNFPNDQEAKFATPAAAPAAFPILPVGLGAGVLVILVVVIMVMKKRQRPAVVTATVISESPAALAAPVPEAPAVISSPPPTADGRMEAPRGPKFCPECGTSMGGQPVCAQCGYQTA